MAGAGSAQTRLDRVVQVIASNMVAEVCSVYLMRGGDSLELFASEGLKASAVHSTRLRVGEGLVGEIAARAQPLALADAQSHPSFAYRPETGEEIYHSLMGVPIQRSGRVIGVLVVQNRTRRHYSEEEIEALQTVAMVLAELVGAGDLVAPEVLREGVSDQDTPRRLDGLSLADGVAIGVAMLHEPRIEITQVIADDADVEAERLEAALEGLRGSIDSMLSATDLAIAGEHREVLEAFRMFANDKGWVRRIHQALDAGLTAEAAVQRVQEENRARMSQVADTYLRDRLHDLDDLSNRLIRHLMGEPLTAATRGLPDQAIVLARHMGPADLLDYDRAKLCAVVLEEGSPNSHVAIIARALGIPMVGQLAGVLEMIEPGDRLIVDGDSAHVYLRPSADITVSYRQNIAARQERVEQYVKLRGQPAITRDGVEITLNINAGLVGDVRYLAETGADGIGLFRTEFQFMVSATLPRLKTQRELYATVLKRAAGKPVVFRTLDIGSDKVVPFLHHAREENPALGWRATRLALDRPALLRYQVRALLQAAGGKPLNILFPLIADVAEFKAARAIVDKELEALKRAHRRRPSVLRVGSMLEVPALFWQLEALLPLVDFISIGSNDLLQFLFACDRSNPRLANRYDLLSPSALSFIREVVKICNRHGVEISLCGEAAGRPLEAMALIGLGLRHVSMSPASIGPVKMMVRSLTVAELEGYMKTLIPLPDHSVRAKLREFAQDHDIII